MLGSGRFWLVEPKIRVPWMRGLVRCMRRFINIFSYVFSNGNCDFFNVFGCLKEGVYYIVILNIHVLPSHSHIDVVR